MRGALGASARASFFTTREVRNPTLDTLQEKVASLQVATDSLDAQLAELERQTQDARTRSNALLAAESGLDAIHRQFATREAGARSANVHVAQQPAAAIAGRSMAVSFRLIGVLAGAIAVAAAVLLPTWLRQVYTSPSLALRCRRQGDDRLGAPHDGRDGARA